MGWVFTDDRPISNVRRCLKRLADRALVGAILEMSGGGPRYWAEVGAAGRRHVRAHRTWIQNARRVVEGFMEYSDAV